MTDPVEQPLSGTPEPAPHAAASQKHHEEVLLSPMATQQAVQQLRDAGFTDDEQAALTTAFLRVLALWTQQATRDDLHTALHAGEQRLTQQLEALRAEFRREVAEHTAAVRDDFRSGLAQQADLLATPPVVPARRRDGLLWLLAVLLVLTCTGVGLLVAHQLLGW